MLSTLEKGFVSEICSERMEGMVELGGKIPFYDQTASTKISGF